VRGQNRKRIPFLALLEDALHQPPREKHPRHRANCGKSNTLQTLMAKSGVAQSSPRRWVPTSLLHHLRG
jgi:hypothetical protein